MGTTASNTASEVVGSIFSPKVGAIAATSALVGSVGLEVKNRFIQADPNEWLLLIKDGELIKKGVGTVTSQPFSIH